MAITVRTTISGEGDSYIALTFADAYFAKRAILSWTGTNGVKEAALVRATDHIENCFGHLFTDEALALEEIPVKLAQACSEYALRALTTLPLIPDPVVDAAGVTVVTVASVLGPLAEKFQVLGSGTPQLLRSYPAADMLLSTLLRPTAGRTYR